MVQSINWNSYSANQILEMKQKGVQVPDDVLKKAESAVSEKDSKEIIAESNDEKDVEYNITDDTQNLDASEYESKIQDAADLKKQLEEEDTSLKSMVEQFTTKADENTKILTASLEELSMFTDFIVEKQDVAAETQTRAEEEQAKVQETVDEITKEIENKQDEIETINNKVDLGEATEEDQTKAENLQGEIQTIVDNGNTTVIAKESVVTDLNTKTESTMSDLEALTNLVNEDSTDAQKGVDFAKETYDLSNKLYKKGSKAGKIGTIAGSVVGGTMGGVGMNSIKIVQNDAGITNTSTKSSIGLNIGGGISGATIMGSLGSLFGSKNRKIGQAGIDAANQLNQVATNQINTAQIIANNNDIAIGTTTDASSAVTNLSDTIKDVEIIEPEKNEKTSNVNNENNKLAETPTTSDKTEVDDENKKKKEDNRF